MIAALLIDAVAAATGTDKITIDDIEARFRSLQGGTSEKVKGAAPPKIGAGVGAIVFVLLIVYFLGRRRGRKRATVLEIRRVV
jgi:hypothetical protein